MSTNQLSAPLAVKIPVANRVDVTAYLQQLGKATWLAEVWFAYSNERWSALVIVGHDLDDGMDPAPWRAWVTEYCGYACADEPRALGSSRDEAIGSALQAARIL